VRLTGGDDITPEVKEFMARYGVRGYPTLFVMNAEGHAIAHGVDRTVDGILKALSDGEQAEKDFAAMKAKPTPENRKAYRAALKTRMLWDELVAESQAGLTGPDAAEAYTDLAGAYAATGKPTEERATLEKALGLFKDAKDRTSWRVRLATMDFDFSKAKSRDEHKTLVEGSAGALEKLLAELKSEKDAAGEARVHVALGHARRTLGKADEAEKEYDAAIAADPKGAAAPAALMGKANVAWSKKDYAGCKTLLEKIVAEFPGTDEAKSAPSGIANCDKRLKQ
jgi:hypothetical protein